MCVSLLLFSSICTVVGAVTVSGYRGETLDIRCSYLELSGTEYPKFFCKGKCYFGFENVIVGSGSPAKDQRFSVNDDKTNRVFTVTITDLRTEDAGQYWCAVEDGGLFRRAFMEILVYVHRARASVCADITVTAAEGGEAVINCPYGGGYETAYKYFYKGPYRESTQWLQSNGGESPVFNGRFTLKDDHKARLFTVTIRDLQMNDAGEYNCVAGWGGGKSVQLNVIRAPKKPKPVQISTSTIHSDQALGSSSHMWPDLSSSAVNPQSTISTFTDHHVSSDSFMIIITAEASVLLLIGLPLLILAVRQRKKTDGLHSSEFTTSIYQQMTDNPADGDTHTTVCYSCV